MKVIKLSPQHKQQAQAIVDDVINHINQFNRYNYSYSIDCEPLYQLGNDILQHNNITIDDIEVLFVFEDYPKYECALSPDDGVVTVVAQLLSAINNDLDCYEWDCWDNDDMLPERFSKLKWTIQRIIEWDLQRKEFNIKDKIC